MRIFHIYIIITVCIFSSCVSYTITTPDGFAEYEQEGNVFRAISADGIKIRVRQIENKPYGDAEMWMKSIKLYLDGNGYKETDKNAISL